MRTIPRPNEIYRHFKGNMYQIVNIAKHSETMEEMVVYQQLYAPFGVYVRPLDMFMSEVDHVKYPEVTQKYRFEKIQEPCWDKDEKHMPGFEKTLQNNVTSKEILTETATDVEQEEIILDEDLLRFLDADSYEEKLEILIHVQNKVTESMLDTMAVSLDVELKEDGLEERFMELKSCLLKMEHFECNRLR